MGDPSATDVSATATAGAQPGSATGATLVLPVEAAAEPLGITPQAVRKRIAKGTLAARRDGRVWRVILTRATGETSATATVQPGAQPAPQPPQPGAQPV